MKTAQEWFDAYGESHQNGTNKLIHWICIPLIIFSLFGLLMAIPFPESLFGLYFNAAGFVLFLSLVFYLRLSFSLFLGFFIVGSLLLFVNYKLFQAIGMDNGEMALISLGIFVLAWIGQFVGHKIEGAKPSFFEDLQFLMIGPAWLLQFIYKKFGVKI
ncbi:MAG: DUF962 domain-containing protein [Chitinophagales bacterium]|jgi:uncharacterized membrane protein YGL010W|nr:DUF962 domain-containing protein [Chitinophagales bacterium]|tara:strand:- start:13521 stop:13994 length:474 start_codon:yes stop_codon:yes gene_type:complete